MPDQPSDRATRVDVVYRVHGRTKTCCCVDQAAADRQVAYMAAADAKAGMPVRTTRTEPCTGHHPKGGAP